MKIVLGSDHAGFALKESLRILLSGWGIPTEDAGTYSAERVDYPDIVPRVATAVLSGECTTGILCCGTGIGMCIAANKVPGIRAALAWSPEVARLGREHNDANVLCLGGRFLEMGEAEAILKSWLDASFAGGRHQTRIDKISALERRAFKS
jgi:ribose 5-phosphate isomerase B